MPLAIFYSALLAFFVFLGISSTDAYKEWRDPCGYWQQKLARRAELLGTYEADAKACPSKIRELQANRAVWVKQKALEGMSQADAVRDFETRWRYG